MNQGIVVDDYMREQQYRPMQLVNRAEHRGKGLWIVAPLMELAKVAPLDAMPEIPRFRCEGSVATQLKVAGIPLASYRKFL